MMATTELILFFAHLYSLPVLSHGQEQVGMFHGRQRYKKPRHKRLRRLRGL